MGESAFTYGPFNKKNVYGAAPVAAFRPGNAALLLSTREEGGPSIDQDNFIAVDYWKR